MRDERDQDDQYDRRYMKYTENKDKMIELGLMRVNEMKGNAKVIGEMVDQDNNMFEKINKKADEVNKMGQKNNNRMQRYL